ncbi:glycoside hydrolase family 108 protein [Arenibaculum sp.]|jgi:lysozyme family protein|uniref:glycoside hydrolase family 108 protein n=1 Tax=Arenibaculum sp. TaxID=2865862 RepID=UPI002E0FD9F1|nr:glycosyl hydrolase 108 family protein [Arenibaculum sp.]
MTEDAFSTAVRELLRHEGGLVDHPADPGGITRWGISLRFAMGAGDLSGDGRPDLDVDGDGEVTREDIMALPLDRAISVYERVFWHGCRCPEMPAAVAVLVFDAAVNQGRGPAITLLQRSLRVGDDGRIGPVTLDALRRAAPGPLLADYAARRAQRYAATRGFDVFGLGWMRRLAAMHQFAALTFL